MKAVIILKLFQELGLTRLVENSSLPRMKEPSGVSEPRVETISRSSISENRSIAFLHRPQVKILRISYFCLSEIELVTVVRLEQGCGAQVWDLNKNYYSQFSR